MNGGQIIMKIVITIGTGEGLTSLAAFDAALLEAGIANYNLIYLSSIIPRGTNVERATFVAPSDEYGHRLYVVMARCDEYEANKEAWASLGWTQEHDSGCGLFVELTGTCRTDVQVAIDSTLASMKAGRGREYDLVDCEIAGIECRGRPVCAIVAAVYKSEGWA